MEGSRCGWNGLEKGEGKRMEDTEMEENGREEKGQRVREERRTK